MSPVQTVALAVRLFAVWLAVYWARWFPYAVGQARESAGGIAWLATVAILLAAGVAIMWFFPRTLARSILPRNDPGPVAAAAPDTWFAVGSALLGLWVLAEAIPPLVQNLAVLFIANRANASLPDNWGIGVFYYLVELTVAVWLLMGAAGVRKLWRRARDVEPAP